MEAGRIHRRRIELIKQCQEIKTMEGSMLNNITGCYSRPSTVSRIAQSSLALCLLAGITVLPSSLYAHDDHNGLSSNDPVHACVQKDSGQVRIVATNVECKRNEVRINLPA